MKGGIYGKEIIYYLLADGKNIITKTVTKDSLHKIVDNFINDNGYFLWM